MNDSSNNFVKILKNFNYELGKAKWKWGPHQFQNFQKLSLKKLKKKRNIRKKAKKTQVHERSLRTR